jgi:hypothetical protein
VAGEGCSGDTTLIRRRTPPTSTDGLQTKDKIMKTLIKLVCMAALLVTTVVGRADWVGGYTRSNGTCVGPYCRSDYGSVRSYSGYSSGYVYRNPYAAYPSVSVNGYYRSSGTYVSPYVRTAPNSTVIDKFSYRGFGTIRVPRNSLSR